MNVSIVKTFGLSQLVFTMKSIALPRDVLERINTIFFKFVWKKQVDDKRAFEKLKRNVLCNDFLNGGLRMIDIRCFQDSILLDWARSLITASDDNPWADIAISYFSKLGGKMVFKSHSKSENFIGSNLIISTFWKSVLEKWLDFSKTSSYVRPVSRNDPICNNSNITMYNNVLFLPSSIRKGIITVNDVMIGTRLLNLEEFRGKFGEYPRCLLDYFTISNALKDLCRHDNFNDENAFYFGDYNVLSLDRKLFYDIIRHPGTPLCASRWKRQYNVEIATSHWAMVHSIKESKLKALTWKVLHNIYPTNILLFKMKLSNTQNCKYCGQMDFLEHFFYSCVKINPLWKNIKNDIYMSTGVRYDIQEADVLLGAQRTDNILRKTVIKINYWLAIGKMVISKYRYGKSRNIFEIYETECQLRKLK